MMRPYRLILVAVLMMMAARSEGARCEEWESRPHVLVSVGSQVYVVSTGRSLCVDRWTAERNSFEEWFSSPSNVTGTIVSVQFPAPTDIEVLTSTRPGVYSLNLLHVGATPEQTYFRHLWTSDVGDMPSAAHPLGSARWLLPTSSGGLVIASGRIECSMETEYSGGPPADSAIGNGYSLIVAGHQLWRYRPRCDGSSDAGHKRVPRTLQKVAAFRNEWLAVGSDGARTELYVIDEKLRFVGKVDLGAVDEEVDLTSNADGVVASIPSLGIAYAYGRDGLRRMTVGRGFTAPRSASVPSLLFSDGTTVQMPKAVTPHKLIDIRELTVGRTTFVPTAHDLLMRSLLLMALTAVVLVIGIYYVRKRSLRANV